MPTPFGGAQVWGGGGGIQEMCNSHLMMLMHCFVCRDLHQGIPLKGLCSHDVSPVNCLLWNCCNHRWWQLCPCATIEMSSAPNKGRGAPSVKWGCFEAQQKHSSRCSCLHLRSQPSKWAFLRSLGVMKQAITLNSFPFDSQTWIETFGQRGGVIECIFMNHWSTDPHECFELSDVATMGGSNAKLDRMCSIECLVTPKHPPNRHVGISVKPIFFLP